MKLILHERRGGKFYHNSWTKSCILYYINGSFLLESQWKCTQITVHMSYVATQTLN